MECQPINAVAKETEARLGQSKRRVIAVAVTAALVFNTVLLVAILALVAHMKIRVDHIVDHGERMLDSVENGEPTPGMVRFTSSLIGDAANVFFFGSTSGTIAGFFQNLFEYDFNGFGQTLSTFAAKMQAVMQNAPSAQDKCQPMNGGLGCIYSDVYDVMAGVNSIAGKIGTFTDVTNAPSSQAPAFSDGLFRIDTVLNWVKSQGNATAWKSAGQVCNQFVTQMNAVSWYGTFTTLDNRQQTWDIRNETSQLMGSFAEVCGRLANLTP